MSSPVIIANLAGPQGLIVIMLILLLFGAKRLPELGKSLGETMRQFSKGREEAEDDDDKKLPPKA